MMTWNTILLVIANLSPLYGVAFMNWSFTLLLFLYWSEIGIMTLVHTIKFLKVQDPWGKSKWPGILKFYLVFGACMTMYLGFMLLIFLPTDASMKVLLNNPIELLKQIGWAYISFFFWHGYEAYISTYKVPRDMISVLEKTANRLVLMHLIIVVGGILYINISKQTDAGPWIMGLVVILKTYLELKASLKFTRHG